MPITGGDIGKASLGQNKGRFSAHSDKLDTHESTAGDFYSWDRQRLPYPAKRQPVWRFAFVISTVKVKHVCVPVIAHYTPVEMASHPGHNGRLSTPVDVALVDEPLLNGFNIDPGTKD